MKGGIYIKFFISGGCKNGKSFYAQRLANAQKADKLYYIATMEPIDLEDRERIIRHRYDRTGWGFIDLEIPDNLGEHIKYLDRSSSYLFDSVTAILSNEMFRKKEIVEDAYLKVSRDLLDFTKGFKNIVFVSDYIYSDGIDYGKYSEIYRRGLGYIDCLLAEECDVVIEIFFSNIIVHKGLKLMEKTYEKFL